MHKASIRSFGTLSRFAYKKTNKNWRLVMKPNEEIEGLIRDKIEERIEPVVQKVLHMQQTGKTADEIEKEIVDDLMKKMEQPEIPKIVYIWMLW